MTTQINKMSKFWITNSLCAISALLTTVNMAYAQKEASDTMVYEGKRIKVTFMVNDKLDSSEMEQWERILEQVDSSWQGGSSDQKIQVEKKVIISQEEKENAAKEMEIAEEEMEKAAEEMKTAKEEMKEAKNSSAITMESSEDENHNRNIKIDIPNTEDKDNYKDLVITNWWVLDLGFNNMVNASGDIRMPEEYRKLSIDRSSSLNFHLGVIQQGIRLDKGGKFRIVYGAGIEYNNYRFENDVDLTKNQDALTFKENEDRNYKKNKLVTQYITVPLMLNFKSNPKDEDKSFNVALGVQAGYLFRTQQKQKWKEGGQTQKSKVRGDFNVNEYRYGYVAQFGYGNFNIYGKYYPTPVFRKGEGPEMYSASVGIVLIPF